jgi:hypothetical protein
MGPARADRAARSAGPQDESRRLSKQWDGRATAETCSSSPAVRGEWHRDRCHLGVGARAPDNFGRRTAAVKQEARCPHHSPGPRSAQDDSARRRTPCLSNATKGVSANSSSRRAGPRLELFSTLNNARRWQWSGRHAASSVNWQSSGDTVLVTGDRLWVSGGARGPWGAARRDRRAGRPGSPLHLERTKWESRSDRLEGGRS